MTQTTAAALRPGAIVVDPETGEREYAAFDTDTHNGRTTIWTAVSDQRFGWPEKITMDADTALTVAAR